MVTDTDRVSRTFDVNCGIDTVKGAFDNEARGTDFVESKSLTMEDGRVVVGERSMNSDDRPLLLTAVLSSDEYIEIAVPGNPCVVTVALMLSVIGVFITVVDSVVC